MSSPKSHLYMVMLITWIQSKQEPKTIRPELYLKPAKYKVAIGIVVLDHPLKSFSS